MYNNLPIIGLVLLANLPGLYVGEAGCLLNTADSGGAIISLLISGPTCLLTALLPTCHASPALIKAGFTVYNNSKSSGAAQYNKTIGQEDAFCFVVRHIFSLSY